MKRLLLAACCAILLGTVNAQADNLIPIDEAHFPDANFRAYLTSETSCYQTIDGDNTKYVQPACKTINCNDKNIVDLTGIEYYSALNYLYCANNPLTSLDVSKNTKLTTLACYGGNQLSSLNVSGCIALDYLRCTNNQLSSLDLSNNTALKNMYCYGNKLTSLDLSNNTALEHLRCYSNLLTSLDLSKNTQLLTMVGMPNGNTIQTMHAVNTLQDGKKVDVYYLRLDDVEGSENFITNVVRDLEQWPTGTEFDDEGDTGNGFHLSRVKNWISGAEVFSGGRQGNAPCRSLADDTYQLVADHVQGDILLLDPNNKRLQYTYDTGNSTVGDVTFTLTWTANNVVTWIDDVEEVKPVAAVQYVNLNGQVSDEPWQGVNVVVTTYTDGTRHTEKRMY